MGLYGKWALLLLEKEAQTLREKFPSKASMGEAAISSRDHRRPEAGVTWPGHLVFLSQDCRNRAGSPGQSSLHWASPLSLCCVTHRALGLVPSGSTGV